MNFFGECSENEASRVSARSLNIFQQHSLILSNYLRISVRFRENPISDSILWRNLNELWRSLAPSFDSTKLARFCKIANNCRILEMALE